jgi:hypothetical protein
MTGGAVLEKGVLKVTAPNPAPLQRFRPKVDTE